MIVAVIAVVCISPTWAADIQGVVKNSSGARVSGAFVKLRNAERPLTFMVISQAEGRYTAIKLPPGKYTVQGVGNGFQSEWSAAVDVAGGGSPAIVNLSLTASQAAALTPAWPGRLSEEEAVALPLPEGAGKELVAARCTTCHESSRVMAKRADPQAWNYTISNMRGLIKAANLPDLTENETKVILKYLVTHVPSRAFPDPNSRLPRTLMKGEATKYRVVQYKLENAAAETHDIAVDPQGNGWANQVTTGKLGRLDGETLEYSEVSPPLTKAERANLGNPQISSAGVIWLPDGSTERRWLSYDIKTGKWNSYDFPTTIRGGAGGNSMALGLDGTVWGSGPGAVRSLNPATGEWRSFDSPTWLKTKQSPGGYGIAVAGDGRAWLAENNADQMARVDPATGKVDEFKIPVKGHLGAYAQSTVFPRRMGTDGEGNIWVALWLAGSLLKIDYKTAEMASYMPPSGETSGAYSVSVDNRNNLVWVSLHRVDKLARFNPKTKEWVEFPLPQAETDVRRIEVDPHNPNRVWFSGVGPFGAEGALMGYLEVLDGK
ncbi:MAG: carboxypeptidase regulatory-like domain-containing protein [Acidobacteria bacterium]|nr:carboxypeptidase regulatory-like domain-containing protein [Acidobacteriota bacterium]